MKYLSPLASALALAAVAWTSAAHADASTDRLADIRFDQLDRNGDGYLAAQELSPTRERLFKAADTNHDGRVTVAEVRVAQAAADARRRVELFRRLDKNGDGRLDAAEARTLRQFRKLDKNGDGQVEPSELSPRTDGKARGLGVFSEPAKKGEAHSARPRAQSTRWQRVDADHDGRLSREEFRQGYSKRLPKLGPSSAHPSAAPPAA